MTMSPQQFLIMVLKAENIPQGNRERFREQLSEPAACLRFFDEMKAILPFQHIKALKNELHTIIQNADVTETHPLLTDKQDIDHLANWSKSISAMGCDSLINNDGILHDHIIYLINGKDLIDHQKSAFLLRAYISGVFQEIIEDLPPAQDEATANKTMAVIDYFYHHYIHPWTVELLQERNLEKTALCLQKKEPSLLDRFNKIPLEKKILIGSGVLASAAMLGLTLFRNPDSLSDCADVFTNAFGPP